MLDIDSTIAQMLVENDTFDSPQYRPCVNAVVRALAERERELAQEIAATGANIFDAPEGNLLDYLASLGMEVPAPEPTDDYEDRLARIERRLDALTSALERRGWPLAG